MKTTIIIKEGRKKKEIKVDGYFLIASDPDEFKGIKFYSSSMNSIPRMMGWVEWAKGWLRHCQEVCLRNDALNNKKK